MVEGAASVQFFPFFGEELPEVKDPRFPNLNMVYAVAMPGKGLYSRAEDSQVQPCRTLHP